MQGFETCCTVQTCLWHAHERNRVLVLVIIAVLCPLNDIHFHLLSLLYLLNLLTDFDIASQLYWYDDILNKFAFQIGRVKVKVTFAIFRKQL